MKVVKNDISKHIPLNSLIVGFSKEGELWSCSSLTSNLLFPSPSPPPLLSSSISSSSQSTSEPSQSSKKEEEEDYEEEEEEGERAPLLVVGGMAVGSVNTNLLPHVLNECINQFQPHIFSLFFYRWII